MELFKKIGAACRLHYEKILLTVALLALGGTVFYLYGAKEREQENIRSIPVNYDQRQVAPVKGVALAPYQAALQAAENPPAIVFAGTHNLFNPVKWQRKSDGSFVKIVSGREVGADAMIALRFTPINLTLNLDKSSASGYYISVANEAATNQIYRGKVQRFATLNNPNKIPGSAATFKVVEVKGPVEDPAELAVELSDSGERVTVAKDKPYIRVEGHAVDLKYPLEDRTFLAQRVGAVMRFAGDTYTVVAVSKDEAVLSGSNDKRYQVRLAPGGGK